jgi:hypothetical protein
MTRPDIPSIIFISRFTVMLSSNHAFGFWRKEKLTSRQLDEVPKFPDDIPISVQNSSETDDTR